MQATLTHFPKGISRNTLSSLRDDLDRREAALKTVIGRFEAQYGVTLEGLETRLERGQGQEHPDWEDSIEWRNAVDELRQTNMMKSVLEWLLRSKVR
jgi:hypothetical protein